MDRSKRTLNVVTALNLYNNGNLPAHKLVDEVCEYFDYIKNQELNDADKRFLIYLSNKVGIPQYYDILNKFNLEFQNELKEENICLDTFTSILYESTLYTDDFSKLHQYQMDILNLFTPNQINRFFLSASTSFGKTHLVYEVIKKMQYKNIALIFPSIALLTENLAKIKEEKVFFKLDYKIHTLSEIDNDYGENNIFIFTPERFLSFLDKKTAIKLDFIFVDEVYKIDSGYIIDDETIENERDVAYRMAIFYGLTRYSNTDLLLAGPYIEIFNANSPQYNPSFDLFLDNFNILKLLRNEFEIVKVIKEEVESKNKKTIIDEIEFDFNNKTLKKDKIQEILDKIRAHHENAIVYCNTQANAEKVANEYNSKLISHLPFINFIEHLKSRYNNDWIVIKALEKGVGIHHGVIPKYIQKEIVNLFNSRNSGIDVLVSTTTITEGVNTTAKNMIVYKSQKGAGRNGKPLLTFDAKNIAGRAGRFMEHYKGRVISLDRAFIKAVSETGEQIKHKNYDLSTTKKEIDYEMTSTIFLDDRSKNKIDEISKMQMERNIPEDIISQFKVISRRDKILIYDHINQLSVESHNQIVLLIRNLNKPIPSLNKDGFQIILDIIYNIIDNETLKGLIKHKYKDKFNSKEYSVLYVSLNSYMKKGFNGLFDYYLEKEKNNKFPVDIAMRKSSILIFNTFKYQLVKYLGVFNLMYKFWISKSYKSSFEEAIGIDKLLIKLEYNAFSQKARIASDYGVPQRIIDFYDSNTLEDGNAIFKSFDKYERQIYYKIKNIIDS